MGRAIASTVDVIERLPGAQRASQSRMVRRSLAVILLLCACSSNDGEAAADPSVERSEADDIGSICVAPPPDGGAFTELSVVTSLCVCTRVVSSSCEAEEVGGEIVVSSSFQLETPLGVPCPTGCGPVSTGCTPLELPPGQYTIALGDLSATIALDSGPLLISRSSVSAVDSCD